SRPQEQRHGSCSGEFGYRFREQAMPGRTDLVVRPVIRDQPTRPSRLSPMHSHTSSMRNLTQSSADLCVRFSFTPRQISDAQHKEGKMKRIPLMGLVLLVAGSWPAAAVPQTVGKASGPVPDGWTTAAPREEISP